MTAASEPVVGDLPAADVRVLGCLVEKESTTPGSYPLTLNALVNACNQRSSRDPVLELSEQEVQAALLHLRDRRLARPVRNPGDRVTKFRHAVGEVLDLGVDEVAILSVLALRGPQTVGELRTRSSRQYAFETVDEVAEVLAGLAVRTPALALELPRGPGQKEPRWTHVLGDHPDGATVDEAAATATPPAGRGTGDVTADAWVAGARSVAAALADPAVARAWDQPSVLEDQAVSSLAGHLARGAVWVVGDYLDGDQPEGPPDFASAGAYFAEVVGGLSDDDHRAIRDRGAAVAAVGHQHLVRTLQSRLAELAERIAAEDLDRLVAVYAGRSIRLGDYLATRIVEQAVHLDDLARSVDGLAVELPDTVVDIALSVGLDTLRRQGGNQAAIRALYRDGFADAFPVL